MAAKAFRVQELSDFLDLAEQVSSPKFIDTSDNGLAFFYARKRIEYQISDKSDIEKLVKKGFIVGTERETFESW